MKIYCAVCLKYLGFIREATLFKGIKYLCPDCGTKRVASDMYHKTNADSEDDFISSFLKGNF